MPKKPLVPELAVTITTSPGLGRESAPLTFSSSDVELLPTTQIGLLEIAYLKMDCMGGF